MNLTPYPGETGRNLGQRQPSKMQPNPNDTRGSARDQQRIMAKSNSVVLRRLRKRRGECLSCGLNLSEDAAAKAVAPGLNIPIIANTTGLCQVCASGSLAAPAPVTATTSDKGFEKDGLHPGAGQSTKQPDRIASQRKSVEEHEEELGNLLKPPRELSIRTKAKGTTNSRRSGLSKSRSQRESFTGLAAVGALPSSSRVTPIKLYQSPLDDYVMTSKYELEERRRQAMAKSNSMRRQQQQQLPPPKRPGQVDNNVTSQAPLEMGVVSMHNGQEQPAKSDQPHRHSSSSDVGASDISTLGAESVMSKGVTLKRIRDTLVVKQLVLIFTTLLSHRTL